MFKIDRVEINGFWQTKTVKASFRPDVNIVIGRNGTGKTTFMNILHAVLTVDPEALSDNYFSSVIIALKNGARRRTIKVTRFEPKNAPNSYVEYQISTQKFIFPLFGGDDGRQVSLPMRRRLAEEALQIRAVIGGLVSIASLSVYRVPNDLDPEVRDRSARRITSSVDARLLSLMTKLTQYQLELSSKARLISTQLQRDVLASLLYSQAKSRTRRQFASDFDGQSEKERLLAAYKQLGVSGSDITKKIETHIAAVSQALTGFEQFTKSSGGEKVHFDFAALDAFRLTRDVVEMSLDAEERTAAIYGQIELFLQRLSEFIADKKFGFNRGQLEVKGEGEIPLVKLSSGEKQLMILLIEALLQREQPFVFLADEPELSLHIAWQREIVGAVQSLNPNAQILVATHSPEIAGRFGNALIDMEDIFHVKA